MTQTLTLNEGQQKAAEGFLEFMLSDEKELIIKGGGGVGKTTLMRHVSQNLLSRYQQLQKMLGAPGDIHEMHMTAMTNQAAQALSDAIGSECPTIHSFLSLTVRDNYRTGESTIQRGKNWRIIYNKLIVIDECSMIDRNMYKHIDESTCNCKIVYVGDHCQLPPIHEKLSPIYNQRLREYELTEPMRNADSPDLQRVCQQLRDTVKTPAGQKIEFKPIPIIPGSIDLLDNAGMEAKISELFSQQNPNARILAYTNNKVQAYNDHIRTLRGLPDTYTAGEFLVNNDALHLVSNGETVGLVSVEEQVEILDVDEEIEKLELPNNGELEVQRTRIRTSRGIVAGDIPMPVNRMHVRELKRFYAKQKNWQVYYFLKNVIPDFRPRDASTVHKAQGQTLDEVIIDLNNIGTCHDPWIVARLLYVAFTRARTRTWVYGPLSEKYGGLLLP